MKAIGYYVAHPIAAKDALVDIRLPTPQPGPRDLRVAVKAVSVDPADVKIRASAAPTKGEVRVLVWSMRLGRAIG
jgi:NADPH:quinone reductase-like Zn-dependent oxidoreductase